MKKKQTGFFLIATILFAALSCTTAFAQEHGYLTPGSILPYDASSCDEKPFSGMVPDAVLKKTGGASADAIEIMYRAKKEQKYKAKRVHIDARANMAFPVRFDNGKCARIYSTSSLTGPQLLQLLTTDESLELLDKHDAGSNKKRGAHYTTAIYLIRKKTNSKI